VLGIMVGYKGSDGDENITSDTLAGYLEIEIE
jgi:hypothetical protein